MLVATSVQGSGSVPPSLWENQVIWKEGKIKFQTWVLQKRGLKISPVPRSLYIRLGIMLLLLIFLPSMYCDLGSLYTFYETVIPRSLAVQGRHEDPVEKASYVLLMQGQKQLIHLKVKREYFVKDFPVFSYHNGILGQEMPFISHDCHYEGYIEGVPGSFVSVSTCSGLRGILVKEGTSYGIKPLETSQRFEHALYTVARQARASCGVSAKDSQAVPTSRQQEHRKPSSAEALSSLWTRTKYVEMFVVVNHQRFRMWGSSINETVQRVMDITALANGFTRGINTEVVLAGMEIWTEGDLIEVPEDLGVSLRNFNSWRQETLSARVKHDVAHMIVGHHPAGAMGQAFLSGACSRGFAAAIESFYHEDVLLFVALMVHELGHNLGIQHDHPACICKDQHFCLMQEGITPGSGFSNCSSDYYYHFLREHRGACLFDRPQHKSRRRRDALCGDGVVQAGEQCDCGSDCDSHPCCEETCTLKDDAQCSEGLCCSDCQLKRRGSTCRPALGECDLPEYCSGTSSECPKDRFKLDGTQCDIVHYCVGGQCQDPDIQCMNIYGEDARSASEDCYLEMNSKGNRFGNCGYPASANQPYVKCFDEDVFCGKLICTNIKKVPPISPYSVLIQVAHQDDFCWSMDAHATVELPESGDVHSGTYCAPDKVCMNHSCTDYGVFNYDCEPGSMCNGKGVCNDLRHCHCDYGYAPPGCVDPGNGGSVDSGPPEKTSIQTIDESTDLRFSNEEKEILRKVAYVVPAFLVILLLLLIIFVSLRTGIESVETPGASSITSSARSSETAISQTEAPGQGEPAEAPTGEGLLPPEEAPPSEEAPPPEEGQPSQEGPLPEESPLPEDPPPPPEAPPPPEEPPPPEAPPVAP
ncbi:disintegrin and metalloproteinase domain-containing protein 1a-like [Erinaceus europaeus]|uniref:Disintegrin and metalloproteinase domain-containing protein 1a-like n=1 Tax=Erinaceus europaeus TaxID=9365 RepID=A0A1S3A5B0_ERIEU|nr:disintegrin and metalloproteinase domain-containing protein 1a-like [Erinaceus europaeus]